jgi:serine/threonine protein kinase HipA of HipAB toxin-antitoxin module
LLHYLKPEHYGLRVRRGKERFVDVELRRRERFACACEAYSRVVLQGERRQRISSFAGKMRADAFSVARDEFESVVELVIAGVTARNGLLVIRKATGTSPIRRQPLTIRLWTARRKIWDCR